MNRTLSEYFSIAQFNFKARKGEFFPFFLMMMGVNFFEIFPDLIFKNNPAFQYHLAGFRILFLILSVLVTSLFIKKYKNIEHPFIYVFMPFFLYSIYYSLIFLLGLVLLIIPGLIFMVVFYYLPIIGIFTKEKGLLTHLKKSYSLSLKHLKLTIVMAFLTLLMEIFPITIMSISNAFVMFLLHAFFSGIMSLVFIYFLILGLKIYDEEI